MSSLFYINIKNHEGASKSRNSLLQVPGRVNQRSNKLLLEPQKVSITYQKDKTYVQKIHIQNTFNHTVTFKIIQPKNTLFNVKYKKTHLNHKETDQLFLFFNSQNEKSNIEDQFIVILERERFQVHVPILCKAKFKTSHRRLSVSKSIKFIQPQGTNKDFQKKSKTNALILKRRPMTTKKLSMESDMQNIVSNFLERFSQIREFVREKNVKKQIFIGEKALSEDKYNKITTFNQQMNEYIVQKMRKKVQSRSKVQFSQEGPLVRNFEGIILRWSKEKNIPKLVYLKGLAKVQQKVRQYLVELRFQKIHRIFSLYRQFQASQEHQNLPLHKKHELYVEKLQKKLNRKQQISLELNFDWGSVVSTRLPCQRETFRKVEFGINPRIGFDNWVPIEEGARYSHEVMGYQKKQAIPQWLCHPKFDKKNIKLQPNTTTMKIAIDSPINQNQQQRTAIRQEDTGQLDFILDLIRLQRKEESQMEKSEKVGSAVGSRVDLKINSDQNNVKKFIRMKSSSRLFSIRNLSQLEKDQDKYDPDMSLLFASLPSLSYFSMRQKQPFHQFIDEEKSPSEMWIQSGKIPQREVQEMVLKQIRRPRYNLDLMNRIRYSRPQDGELECRLILSRIKQRYHPSYKHYSHPVQLIQSSLGAKFNIIRKLSKQDKHEFQRLDSKAIRILQMIENQQKLNNVSSYKLKSEVELETSGKYTRKTLGREEGKMERELQNLQILKQDSLGKTQFLQVYAYLTAKNKQLAFFLP